MVPKGMKRDRSSDPANRFAEVSWAGVLATARQPRGGPVAEELHSRNVPSEGARSDVVGPDVIVEVDDHLQS
jgi:hypothetical protein